MPWSRLLAEGTVIVLSILLAFAIDAWWSERQSRDDFDSLLEFLVTDVLADADEMAARAVRSDSILLNVRRMELRGTGGAGAATDAELRLGFNYLFQTSQTDPSLSAYEVARGSDAWSRVSPGVKVSLSEYMRGPYSVDRLRDIDALARLNDVWSEYLPKVLEADEESDSLALVQALDAYLKDPRTQSWIGTRVGGISSEREWQRTWADRLPAIADSLGQIR
jgi:hypothetical protein